MRDASTETVAAGRRVPPRGGGASRLCRSFWLAGFEGADHVNGSAHPLNMIEQTQHDVQAAADYARIRPLGFRSVRETIGWRVTERHGRFDDATIIARARAARMLGTQVLWTYMHYGVPDGVDLFAPSFVDRFAHFCRHVTEVIVAHGDGAPPIVTPINEISFLAWAICETGLIHPFRGDLAHRGYALKQQLVRAAIAGCEAIWSVDARARILHTDPLVHIVAAGDDPATREDAQRRRSYQFQAWDMLAGTLEPSLRGGARYLDLLGVNYYHGNQWEHPSEERLHWHLGDPRRRPLADLLSELHTRYGRPLLISETSHVGEGRGEWIAEIADEVIAARARGVPVEGVCIYPIIDRPDWEDPSRWHHSGLWDVERVAPGHLARRLCEPYARDFHSAQWRTTRALSDSSIRTSQGLFMPPVIVFSHLRWDFVFQRPQHLLTRLARHAPILFVEEPVYDERPAHAELSTPQPGVTVLRPHTPIAAAGFHDEQLAVLRTLLQETIAERGWDDYVAWFYTPMALPLLQDLEPRAIVYDCMDELTAFRNAPRQLLQRESALLKLATVVFTGGPSLYAAKRTRHANVHCFPSSVDTAHFAQGRDPAGAHPLLDGLARPRLGFFGVIDERFDAALVGTLAAAHPEWQVCLVGPVVKIDPATLPRAANIHYFPQQAYADLPALLAGWDACLLPFAHNEATRFISPTKTLEYMAAERPVVSTDIVDVVSLYGSAVEIAATPKAFVEACERVLAESATERAERVGRMRLLTAQTSWDDTALRMRSLMEEAVASGVNAAARSMLQSPADEDHVALPLHTRVAHADCLVLGAGPTGLSAGYHAGKGSLVLERSPTVGGWCRSIEDKGFTFDYAGHIMFSNDPYVLQLYRLLLDDNVHWQNREAWVYSKSVYTRYPFQGALYGLPPDVLKECIMGAIEARFGKSQAPQPSACGASPSRADPKTIDDCCADGVSEATAVLGTLAPVEAPPQTTHHNFETFIHDVWGAGVARHFALPYNRKLWTVPLSEMETSWLGGRVPLPNLEEMIDGALKPIPKPMGPNARFGYPLRGGFQALMEGFVPLMKGELVLDADVRRVSPSKRTVSLADGRTFGYDVLVSTLPLPELIKAIGDEAPEDVREAVSRLRHVSVRCVNLGIGREDITDKHWIYYPEDTIFHRVFVQGNASPHCNPPGGFGLTCEITYSPYKPLPLEGQALIDRCVRELVEVGLIRASDPILTANQVDMRYAYVIYDHSRAESVACIRAWLAQHRIILAGRYSEWEYYNSDHAFIAGKRAAESALALLGADVSEARTA